MIAPEGVKVVWPKELLLARLTGVAILGLTLPTCLAFFLLSLPILLDFRAAPHQTLGYFTVLLLNVVRAARWVWAEPWEALSVPVGLLLGVWLLFDARRAWRLLSRGLSR